MISNIFSIKKDRYHRIITVLGIKVKFRTIHNRIDEILDYMAYFKARTLFTQHYNIKIPAECCGLGRKFELVNIRLGDLRRSWDGVLYELEDCAQYKYLDTRNENIYNEYIQEHINRNMTSKNTAWSVEQFNKLEESININGYTPQTCIIAIDKNNVILDGVHRSSILIKKFGKDYTISAIRVSS